MRFVYKKDDTNAIEIYKELNTDKGHQIIFVGHLPMEISCLMKSFLKSREENTLIAEVTGSRKRENGLVVYIMDIHSRTKLQNIEERAMQG